MMQYRDGWPIHEMMKQFLGSQKANFRKDTESELEEIRKPDRKQINAYISGLPSQKPRKQASGSDNEEEEEEEEEPQKYISPDEMRRLVLERAKDGVRLISLYSAFSHC